MVAGNCDLNLLLLGPGAASHVLICNLSLPKCLFYHLPIFFNFYIEIIIGSYRQLLREHKVIPFTLTHSPPMAVTNVSMVQHQNQKINIGVTCVYVCGSVRLYNMCGFVATTTMIKAQYHSISTTISLFPSAIANPCSSRICCLCL